MPLYSITGNQSHDGWVIGTSLLLDVSVSPLVLFACMPRAASKPTVCTVTLLLQWHSSKMQQLKRMWRTRGHRSDILFEPQVPHLPHRCCRSSLPALGIAQNALLPDMQSWQLTDPLPWPYTSECPMPNLPPADTIFTTLLMSVQAKLACSRHDFKCLAINCAGLAGSATLFQGHMPMRRQLAMLMVEPTRPTSA